MVIYPNTENMTASNIGLSNQIGTVSYANGYNGSLSGALNAGGMSSTSSATSNSGSASVSGGQATSAIPSSYSQQISSLQQQLMNNNQAYQSGINSQQAQFYGTASSQGNMYANNIANQSKKGGGK